MVKGIKYPDYRDELKKKQWEKTIAVFDPNSIYIRQYSNGVCIVCAFTGRVVQAPMCNVGEKAPVCSGCYYELLPT